jgi:hypothetical protein
VGAVLAVVVVAACSETGGTSILTPGSAALVQAPKVTVCHAAGLAGTTKYVSITISANGLAGHFGNNGTTKAGHEDDFIATAERPCNAPEAAFLRICKLTAAFDPENFDHDRVFIFKRDFGGDFELKFLGCTEAFALPPGQRTLREPFDTNLPADFSYYAVKVEVLNGSLISSSGFFNSRPQSNFEDAVVTVGLTSGQTTTVTFFNRN